MNAVVQIRPASTVIPSAIEAEQALIGAVLMVNASYDVASGIIGPEDFFDPFHAHVWRAIGTCIGEGRVSSPLTVAAMCGHVTDIAGMSVREYLTRCVTEAMPVEWTTNYARLVKDASVRRRLIVMAERLDADARNTAGTEPGKVLASALSELDEVRAALQAATANDRALLATFAGQYVEKVQDRLAGRGGTTSLHCGLTLLDRQLGGFQRGGVTVVAGRPGMGKQQRVDAKVLTPHGWRRIGDLIVGDMVIGRNGAPTAVTGVFPQGVHPSYRVTFRDGTSTECGLDHLWSVSSVDGRGRGKFVTLSLRDLIDKGLCKTKRCGRVGAKWHVPLVEPVQFAPANLPIDPYCLGVLIGDGSTSHHDIRFSNPDFDSDVRGRFASRLPPDVHLVENRSGSCPYFSIRGDGAASFRDCIRALGLAVTSAHKMIPPAYLLGSVEQRLDLLRGLMDTDGSSKLNRCNFFTTSPQLAADVAGLVRSLGGLSVVRSYDRSHDQKPVEFVVSVKMAIAPFHTARKLADWRRQHPSRYIRSAVYTEDVEQVCISVAAHDNLYVTDDYIVTHNTALAVDLAYRLADQGHAGAFFSIEMGADQMMPRFFSSVLTRTGPRVEYSAIMRGDVSRECLDRMVEAEREMKRLPLFLDTVSSPTISEIQSRCRSATAQLGAPLDFIVVDYLGLVSASSRYQGQRTQEVGEVSRGMKALAKTMGCAVILLAQLNRKNEDRGDKRPELSDLRDSGEIEQDAEAVLFPFREAYYLQSKTDHDSLLRYHEVERVLEIIVAKNRHGSTGSMRLYCDIGANLIDNLQG